jgi:hypothetical protein
VFRFKVEVEWVGGSLTELGENSIEGSLRVFE